MKTKRTPFLVHVTATVVLSDGTHRTSQWGARDCNTFDFKEVHKFFAEALRYHAERVSASPVAAVVFFGANIMRYTQGEVAELAEKI